MTLFILHVGPHKTGTSYLQDAFAAFRTELARRGIIYPTAWGVRAHHALMEQLQTTPNPTLAAQFDELRNAGQPVVLISVEGLNSLREETVAYLRTLIGEENEVRVVFYARSWADILPSHWKQEIKAGSTQTLPEYLYLRMVNPSGSFFVNFGTGLRRHANAFGLEAINIVSYDALMAAKQDLFQHFAATFLNWPDAPKPEATAVNVSPNAQQIEVIRAVNSLEYAIPGSGPPNKQQAQRMAELFIQRADELTGPVLGKALAENTGKSPLNETSATLTVLHRQLYAEFGRTVVAPRPRGVFFQPRRAELTYVRRDYLLVPGVIDRLREVHRQLRVAASVPAQQSAA